MQHFKRTFFTNQDPAHQRMLAIERVFLRAQNRQSRLTVLDKAHVFNRMNPKPKEEGI